MGGIKTEPKPANRGREAAEDAAFFHLTVALHHLRQINADILPTKVAAHHKSTLRTAELMGIAADQHVAARGMEVAA